MTGQQRTATQRTARVLGALATGQRLAAAGDGYRLQGGAGASGSAPGASGSVPGVSGGAPGALGGAAGGPGRLRVTAAQVDRWLRQDLIEATADGYRLSGPGRAWLARQTATAAGEDGAHAQNRLPVRQTRRVDGIDRMVSVNLAESPLGWLLRHRRIDARQFEAGDRLRDDFETARLAPRVTMGWDTLAPSGESRGAPAALNPTLAQLAAKRRFDAALAAVGPGLSDVLWRVACAGEGLDQAERALGWPARAGKVVLGLALDRLADHFGLP